MPRMIATKDEFDVRCQRLETPGPRTRAAGFAETRDDAGRSRVAPRASRIASVAPSTSRASRNARPSLPIASVAPPPPGRAHRERRAPRVASGAWTRRLSDAVHSPQVEPEMPIDPFQEGHAEKQIHTDFYQGFDTKDLSATDLS